MACNRWPQHVDLRALRRALLVAEQHGNEAAARLGVVVDAALVYEGAGDLLHAASVDPDMANLVINTVLACELQCFQLLSIFQLVRDAGTYAGALTASSICRAMQGQGSVSQIGSVSP